MAPIPSLQLTGIDWVIVGGESGPGCRPMAADWVRGIRDRCVAEGVPFFFKQWGGTWKNRNGRILDGRTWDEMPNPVLRQPRGGVSDSTLKESGDHLFLDPVPQSCTF